MFMEQIMFLLQNDLDLSMGSYLIYPYSGGPVSDGSIGKHRKTPIISDTILDFSGKKSQKG